jgi:hypothetical protein
VDSAAGIVTRDNGVELSNTVSVGSLDSTESGGVETTLARSRDTRVDTSGIAVPNVNQEILNSSAARSINELKIEVQRNTRLAISDVGSDQLARDKVRADSDLGDQSTGRVGVKDRGKGGVQSVSSARNIVVNSAPLLQSSLVALGLERLCKMLVQYQVDCFNEFY